MFITQCRVFGHSSSRKGPTNKSESQSLAMYGHFKAADRIP